MSEPALWSPEVEARIEALCHPHRVRFLRRFLADLVTLGARPVIPDAVAQDYLNVRPPLPDESGRLCSVYVSTARIEFQRQAWIVAQAAGLDDVVDHVPAGDLAALDLVSAEQVDAAGRLARALLAAHAL